jgi:hypothetical protein
LHVKKSSLVLPFLPSPLAPLRAPTFGWSGEGTI